MILRDLLKDVETEKVQGGTDVEISDVQFDSRLVREGGLFIAVSGTQVDGHDFIWQCIEKGVRAVVCERMPEDMPQRESEVTFVVVRDARRAVAIIAANFYGHPSERLSLVGVTGTNGKTTTATLLWKIVRAMGHKAGLLSTVCNYVNEEPIPATQTTPDALTLNALLAKMAEEGCEYCFMEVSSHAIAQERTAGLVFRGGIFTNLTRDHLDYHKTFENYRDTKKLFFDGLPREAFAVTNKDDKNGMVMVQNTRATVHTYATRVLADYKAHIVEEGFEGMLLSVNGKEVFVSLVGRFNVSNLLAVYGAALCLGFEADEVLTALSAVSPVNGRFETIRSPKGWTAVIDYAHTPDAVENVINTINEILRANVVKSDKKRLITVIGCGGNRDTGKRPIMAQIAKKGSQVLILTSDNPRNEEPQAILDDMLAGLTEEEKQDTLVITDRRQAIRTACTIAAQGDVILVAGKGHENYQIINGVKHHFDDHEEVKAMV